MSLRTYGYLIASMLFTGSALYFRFGKELRLVNRVGHAVEWGLWEKILVVIFIFAGVYYFVRFLVAFLFRGRGDPTSWKIANLQDYFVGLGLSMTLLIFVQLGRFYRFSILFFTPNDWRNFEDSLVISGWLMFGGAICALGLAHSFIKPLGVSRDMGGS